jgi:hypothetical protein
MTSYETYTMWIKKGSLIHEFPKWEGTNKSKYWWLGWSIAVFFGIIPFTIFVFVLYPSAGGVLTCFFIIYGPYLILLGIIYVCVKNWRKEKQ